MTTFAGIGLAAIAGYLLGMALRSHPGQYANPNLHEGRWVGPVLQGAGVRTRVTWVSSEVRACRGHHRATRCTIGPGMAHLDECVCGATRSGVYGSWLS